MKNGTGVILIEAKRVKEMDAKRRHGEVEPLQQIEAATTMEYAGRSNTEATRVLMSQLGWFFNSYLVCDDRGLIAYCIDDLAEFAEDQGWINYNPSSLGCNINWSAVPQPAPVAADQARTGLNDGEDSWQSGPPAA